jgi:hypothetical protein
VEAVDCGGFALNCSRLPLFEQSCTEYEGTFSHSGCMTALKSSSEQAQMGRTSALVLWIPQKKKKKLWFYGP